ncbi:glycosyltransferase family 2 protein [Aromatoleum petrolei]|uniref:Glycosyltransferase n=1 Tax=Aromatoleum petrolei TaxID=76116 RepID=A0ABX1MP35_9RHOO|nr:glycosyltransferase [Aromatoleum petrolei]NMF88456.1 glycosyltransferase [Aromatoleum petrolei]QTQ36969.1 Glycosyl transferase, family 2 [Aromatoleum petrolei]
MSAPTCSICIANYNGESLLADCIDSVLAQDCDFAFEILIHDDASTDASLALLRDRYPQVEVIASSTNVGFCIANNRLADRARGDYLLLLNNDAALAPDALSTLSAHARLQQPEGILTLPQYDWETNELVDRGCLLDPFYNPVPNLDLDRRDVAMVIGACLWIPRRLWHELGGFPEWFESIAEDMYLCCRARLAGYPVEVTATSAYRHRQGKSFGGNRANTGRLSTTYRRRRLSERNKTFVLTICTPSPWLWPVLTLHLVALAIEGAALVMLKSDSRIWREVYATPFHSLWEDFDRLKRRRSAVQATRRSSSISYGNGFTLVPRKLTMLLKYGIPALR